jgi:hypothetical protein
MSREIDMANRENAEIAERLAHVLDVLPHTQKSVAKKIGMRPDSLSRAKREGHISRTKLDRLEELTGWRAEWIETGEGAQRMEGAREDESMYKAHEKKATDVGCSIEYYCEECWTRVVWQSETCPGCGRRVDWGHSDVVPPWVLPH